MPRQGPRPHTWKAGPDPINHALYLQCQRARAQAKYRKEEWYITEPEYIQLWLEDDRYKYKGRHPEDLCMTRRDFEKPWTVDNVLFITRHEHYKTSNDHKVE